MQDPRDWSHQQKGVELCRAAMTGPDAAKYIVAVSATGSGKSRMAGEIIKLHLDLAAMRGKWAQVIFIVHRIDLVTQMAKTLSNNFGIETGIIMSGYQYKAGLNCYCASIDTLYPRLRDRVLEGTAIYSRPLVPTLLVIDEGHRAVRNMKYRYVFNKFSNAYRIFLTAHPELADGTGLGCVAEKIVEVADYKTLQEKGILAKVRYITAPAEDLAALESKVRKKDGEVSEDNQAEFFSRPKIVGDEVQTWFQHAENRKTLTFCVRVDHACYVAAEYEKAGIKVAVLHAKSKRAERIAVFNAAEKGELKIICNVGLYIEGLDAPDVWCIQICRRLGSCSDWWQIVGRGARVPWPSKYQDLIVIDHGGNWKRHGPVDKKKEWSLASGESVKRKKPEAKESKGCLCQVCGCEFNASSCPDCGTELKMIAKKIEVLDSKLVEVTNAASPKQSEGIEWVKRRAIFSALKWQAAQKGWKETWAAVMYNKMFTTWPNDKRVRDALPVKPGKGSEADRYLQIAMIIHSRGREKSAKQRRGKRKVA